MLASRTRLSILGDVGGGGVVSDHAWGCGGGGGWDGA